MYSPRRLQRRERDHRAEGVVHRRQPERRRRDRRREVAAVVDDRVCRATSCATVEQRSGSFARRMDRREEARELKRPARPPAAARRSARARARTALAPSSPGHPGGEQREALSSAARLPFRRGREGHLVPAAASARASGSSGRKWPSQGMQLKRTRTLRSSAREEPRSHVSFPTRDGDVPRAAGPGQGRDRRDRRGRGARAPGRRALPRRARARGVGRRAPSPARSTCPRGQLESRIEGLVPDQAPRDRPLLLRRLALGVRREGARRARLRERHLA